MLTDEDVGYKRSRAEATRDRMGHSLTKWHKPYGNVYMCVCGVCVKYILTLC